MREFHVTAHGKVYSASSVTMPFSVVDAVLTAIEKKQIYTDYRLAIALTFPELSIDDINNITIKEMMKCGEEIAKEVDEILDRFPKKKNGEGDNSLPVSCILMQLIDGICGRFPGLSPISVYDAPAYRVVNLMCYAIEDSKRKAKERDGLKDGDYVGTYKGKKTIYREAGHAF